MASRNTFEQATESNTKPFLWLSDLMLAARYGVHRSWVWRRLKEDPTFPKPVKLSPGMTRWRSCDVEAWEQAQVSQQHADRPS